MHDSDSDIRIIKVLKEWEPHGIIGHIYDSELADALTQLRIPIVNTTATIPDDHLPIIDVNHRMAGEMATEYFIQKGFRNFGFFGSDWAVFSKEREEGFANRLKSEGFSVPSLTKYAVYG
ncbi:MAG: hypothetical protein WC340_16115 [Kiritimatiellia bacterium]